MNVLEKIKNENIEGKEYLKSIGFKEIGNNLENTYELKDGVNISKIIFYEKDEKIIAESKIKNGEKEEEYSKSIADKEIVSRELLIKMIYQVLPNLIK